MIDHFALATKVIEAAKSSDLQIVTAESCTGGMIATSLTDVAGSSSVFDRGFVTYSYASKTDHLDVAESMLHEFGAVSEPVAKQMALGALAHSLADVAIAVTGVAGPGADGEKAEGLVWFGVATKNNVKTLSKNFGAIGRDAVRLASVKTGLQLLLDEIAHLK